MRSTLLRLHRWISLGFATLWVLQATTGAIIAHRWEIEDATVAGERRATDLAAIERRVAVLAPPGSGWKPVSLWVTAGWPDRYDLRLVDGGGAQQSVRLAGDGTVLRVRDAASRTPMGTLVALHQKLLSGATGEWIIGISGVLLLTNLLLALRIAWPPGSAWAAALTPTRRGPPAARTYSWHRALGLWGIAPALVLVGAGTLLRFEDSVVDALGVVAPASAQIRPDPDAAPIGVATVVAAAAAAIPGSRLTSVVWPTGDDANWSLRMLEPGEIRRAYGTSRVFVDDNTGKVSAVFPASQSPPTHAFVNGLYAVHTGEAGGTVGRLIVVATGLWLAMMIALGVLLWWRRR